jgi:hypothetical protein
MRVLPLIFFWSLLLYSCKEVTFTEPQPKGIASLKEVPMKLRGTYQTVDETTGQFSDTLIIESWATTLRTRMKRIGLHAAP